MVKVYLLGSRSVARSGDFSSYRPLRLHAFVGRGLVGRVHRARDRRQGREERTARTSSTVRLTVPKSSSTFPVSRYGRACESIRQKRA